MKKRMLSILLTACMVLSLLPATALAGGVETEENYLVVSDWEGLLDAMDTIENTPADPVYKGIKIKANNFGWPAEGGTLVIDFADDQKTTTGKSEAGNQYYIYLVGASGSGGCTWEIPANVTLQCYEYLYLGYDSYGATSTVTVNGEVEFMDRGNFGNNYSPYATATVTVNGTLNTSGTYSTNLTNVGLTVSGGGTLNVLYLCNLGEVNIAAGATVNIGANTTISGTLTLADGVHLTGKTLSLQGDLTTPGSAVVENYVQIYHNSTESETVTLSGDLILGAVQLYGTSPVLTIPKGSNVSLERFSSASGVTVNVAGVLDITGGSGSSSFDSSTMTIQSGGTVKMRPSVQFDDEDSNSTIEGAGTLELYGILQEQTTSNGSYIYCDLCPRIFGIDADDTDEDGSYVPLAGVDEENLTVKRMWADCTHTYGDIETVAPTCGTQGYDIQICSECGTELRSNYKAAGGAHSITYQQNGTSGATAACSVCGRDGWVSISVPQSSYAATGEAITPATLSKWGSLGDSIPDAEITYKNNVAPGTATASAAFGGVTISTTFEISACAHTGGEADCTHGPTCSKCGLEYGEPLGHTGGTATCKEQATCTRCEQPYGDLADHTYELAHNDTMHWVECSICGLEYLQDYGIEVTSPDQLSKEVLLKWINVYLELQGGATKDQLIYLEKYSDTPSRHASSSTDFAEGDVCLLCGYGKAVCDHSWNGGKVTTAPTCTTKGVRTYTCSICGGTRTEDIPATGHTEVVDAAVAATCTTGGKTAGSHCSVCGTVLTAQEPIGALGHDWDEGVIATPPTLDANGVKTFTCQRCGETRTEAVPKLEKQNILLPGTSFEKTYGDADFYNTASNLTVGGGALTYSSSNTAVAVVDAQSGKVTIVGAGDAVITVTAAAVANQYAETSVTYTVTVAKAPLTITAKDKAITYGEKAANSGYAVSGFVKDEDESVLAGEAVYSYTYKQYGNVGEYTIAVSGLTAQNYAITFVGGKLTVGKATEYTITLSDLEQLTGHVSGVTARIDPYDTTADLCVEYLVDDSWTETAPQTAGTYQVRASLTASDNIVVPASAAYTTATLTVKPGVTVDTGNGPADVDVAVDVSGGTAEITVTEDDLTQIAENADGQVSIDLGSVSDVDTLVLPGALVEELSKNDKAEGLTVSTENASVTLSADVLDTVAKTVTGGEDTVSVRLESVAQSELSQAQQDALNAITTDYPVAVVDVSLVVTHPDGSTDTLHELGGNVTVTVPYEQLPGLLDGQYVVACYISDDGTVTYLFAQADEANRTITFTTNHFSNYAVFVSGKPTSAVTVDGGSGSGIYLAGNTVTIKADSKSGYAFAGWEVVSGGVTLADTKAAETTFTMPATNVELRATYTKNSSGGGGGVSTYTLTFDTNGGSKIDSVSKAGGATIDLAGYVPTRNGYDFDGWYSDAKLTSKVTSVKLTGNMTVYAKWTEKGGENPFTDVADDAYYADAVIWAVGKGITSGTTATTFSPNNSCTRAQAVTFLWRAAGSPVVNYAMNFSDVSADAYYAEAVRWAVSQGITKGTSDTTFSPNATCTRAQIVTFLWRSQKSPTADGVNPFADVAADAYYTGAVLWAAENGITGGTTANTFSPANDCTRAQIVTFLFRSAK